MRSLSASRLGAWTAAGLFLAAPVVMFWSMLARVDFLASALTLAAVATVARDPLGRWTPVAAAMFSAAAVLSRQTHLFAGPAAIAFALSRSSPRQALVYLATAGGAVASVALALNLATNGAFAFHTVTANVQEYSIARAVSLAMDVLPACGVLALAAILVVADHARDRGAEPRDRVRRALLVGYVLTAAASATTAGKVGSHVNHFIELVAALSLAGGLTIARAESATRTSGALRAFAAVAVVAQAFALCVIDRPDLDRARGRLDDRAQLEQLELEIRATDGPVLADEAMGVVVRANRDLLFDPFDLTQQVREGRWRDDRYVSMLRTQQIALVLIHDGPTTPPEVVAERWTPAMLEAVHTWYEPTGQLGGATVYRPRAQRAMNPLSNEAREEPRSRAHDGDGVRARDLARF